MKTNAEVQRDVLDELLSDPTVAANIQVAADHGAVTLGGSIASYTEKWQSKRAAQRLRGVISVTNNLEVELSQAERSYCDSMNIQRPTNSHDARWRHGLEHAPGQLFAVCGSCSGSRFNQRRRQWAPGRLHVNQNASIKPPRTGR